MRSADRTDVFPAHSTTHLMQANKKYKNCHTARKDACIIFREEVQQHQTRAARQSQRVAELEGILDGVKVRVQDLEDSYISKAAQQHSQFQQLQLEKRDAEVFM